MAEYAEREFDIQPLCEFYAKHVGAMTAEGLHSKSDIAAELAYRDMLLEFHQWKPIETAPKDGRVFQTYTPEDGDDVVPVYDHAYFDQGHGHFVSDVCAFEYVTHWRPIQEPNAVHQGQIWSAAENLSLACTC